MRVFRTIAAAAALVSLTQGGALGADFVVGLPIAKTGIYAFVGTPAANGVELAVEEINASGVLGTNRIRLVTGDDASERAQTLTLINKMSLQDRAIAIVGPAGTTPALAAASLARDHQIPLLSFATSAAIAEVSPWSFHLMAPANIQMEAVLGHAIKIHKPKSVATVWMRDNEGAVALGRFAREWLKDKVELLPEYTVLSADSDFSALTTTLATRQPDLVVLTMADANSGNLLTQARQAGVKAAFAGSIAIVSDGFLRAAGAAAEGTVAPADYFAGRPDAMNRKFASAYEARFGSKPDSWAADGYTAMHLVAVAIAKSGPNPTRQAVRDALAATRDFPVVLGNGSYSFGPNREPIYEVGIVEVRNGEFTTAR